MPRDVVVGCMESVLDSGVRLRQACQDRSLRLRPHMVVVCNFRVEEGGVAERRVEVVVALPGGGAPHKASVRAGEAILGGRGRGVSAVMERDGVVPGLSQILFGLFPLRVGVLLGE